MKAENQNGAIKIEYRHAPTSTDSLFTVSIIHGLLCPHKWEN
jgi:hypothetical protein